MLKQIKFKKWKSFNEATLYIDPLTVLIGTNASGKSNIVDAISFLNKVVQGKDLQTCLDGETSLFLDPGSAIRGGSEWAAMKPYNEFTIEVLIENNHEEDYKYSITVSTSPIISVIAERLTVVRYTEADTNEVDMFYFNKELESELKYFTKVHIYDGEGKFVEKYPKDNISIISQIGKSFCNAKVIKCAEAVSKTLEEIFVLDPVPSLMRNYTSFSTHLARNASNLAGMLAALPEERKGKIENLLSEYLSKLPEGEIKKVWAEPIGRFQKDAMLYCEEKWGDNEETIIVDARGMSDGTLRFLAIITALLTRPEGTLVVIEEADNGLHPSRARLLIKMLKEIGTEAKVDVLITTHNPALMDELGVEMIPFVQVVSRSGRKGESNITLLEDIKILPKLLAYGSLGKITTKGELERSLSQAGGHNNEE